MNKTIREREDITFLKAYITINRAKQTSTKKLILLHEKKVKILGEIITLKQDTEKLQNQEKNK